jgi:acyl carrier protein phosphodiesterase
MNFLAHIYLSGNEEKTLVGNFMGDYVKGSNYKAYPDEIQRGILMHRRIDYFTDTHPVTRESREHLYPKYHKYAGIVVDIFYDYLLTRNWDRYSPVALPDYVDYIFDVLRRHYEIFPQRIKNWFPNFIRNNWLIAYSTIEGIENVLHRMSSRTSLPDFTDFAIKSLRENEEQYLDEFNRFFPDIKDYILEDFGIQTGGVVDENAA